MFTLFVINTLLWSVPLIIFSFFKVILPSRAWRRLWTYAVCWVAETWMRCNLGMINGLIGVSWDIEINTDLRYDNSYLLTANHQSWVDIIALYQATIRKAPYHRFFIKQELIWVPILGLAWWALDFPFMKRYSKAYLEKHPEKRGQDLETTRIACEKFKGSTVSIINFMEGGRYAKDKKRQAESPYKNLLSPKAGGMAFVLAALGDNIDQVLNATIFYPDGVKEFWEFLCGKLVNVKVQIDPVIVPAELVGGDYQNDAEFRSAFQKWTNDLWVEKDQLLEDWKSAANQTSSG